MTPEEIHENLIKDGYSFIAILIKKDKKNDTIKRTRITNMLPESRLGVIEREKRAVEYEIDQEISKDFYEAKK